jgi:hypothetical protein
VRHIRPVGHRVWTTPIERLIDRMGDRRERALTPADDPVIDLEPTPDLTFDDGAGRTFDRVTGEWLADWCHPADRQICGPARSGVAPRVGEMRDHQVRDAVPARLAQVDLRRAVEEQPARRPSCIRECERKPAKDRGSGWQPTDRPAIRRMQEAASRSSLVRLVEPRSTGVASPVARRSVTRSAGYRAVAPQGPSHPPPTGSLTLRYPYASFRATDCTSHWMQRRGGASLSWVCGRSSAARRRSSSRR